MRTFGAGLAVVTIVCIIIGAIIAVGTMEKQAEPAGDGPI